MEKPKFSIEEIEKHAANWQMPDPVLSKSEAWAKLQARIAENPSSSSKSPFYSSLWLRIAAVMAIIFAGGILLLLMSSVELDGIASNNQAHILPCGSEIELADGSHISYNKYLWPLWRQIDFDGQAHFSVRKGRPFKISTPHTTVDVLGTTFTVWVSGDDAFVHCEEGRVRLTGVDEVVLEANDYASLANGSLTSKGSYNTVGFVQFETQGALQFEDAPIDLVCAALSQRSGLTIKSTLPNTLRYTGTLDLVEISTALEVLAKPFDASVNWVGDKQVEIHP